MVEVSVQPDFIVGDTKAQDFEDVLDVLRGLKKFFVDSKYGVLFAKGKTFEPIIKITLCNVTALDMYVAVWRGQKMYYMFDGMKRGPNGIQSILGTGCITRYLSLEKLADVFLKNLPVLGKSQFIIHKVKCFLMKIFFFLKQFNFTFLAYLIEESLSESEGAKKYNCSSKSSVKISRIKNGDSWEMYY